MKTAMQELMQWMEETEFMVNKGFIEKVNECLEKEKEQIEYAYKDGLVASRYNGNENTEEYYNQIYNQEPKKEYQL